MIASAGRPRLLTFLAVAAFLAVLVALSLAVGTREVGWSYIAAALSGQVETVGAAAVSARIPRTLLAALAGAALGLAGAVMQGITRNPLADPGSSASTPAPPSPWWSGSRGSAFRRHPRRALRLRAGRGHQGRELHPVRRFRPRWLADTYFAPAPDIGYADPVYTGGPDLSALSPYSSAQNEQDRRATFLQQELAYDERIIRALACATTTWRSARRTSSPASTRRRDRRDHGPRRPDLQDHAGVLDLCQLRGICGARRPRRGTRRGRAVGARRQVSPRRHPRPAQRRDLRPEQDQHHPHRSARHADHDRGGDGGESRHRGQGRAADEPQRHRGLLVSRCGDRGRRRHSERGQHPLLRARAARLPVGGLHAARRGRARRHDLRTRRALWGAYFFDGANTEEADSRIIVDAAYRYRVRDDVELAVNVDNLFDEKYVAYGGFGADFYNPGRAVSATLRYDW